MIVIGKEVAVAEDIDFGVGPSGQDRGGNKVNALHLPYDGGMNTKEAIDLRALTSEVAETYALRNGNASIPFNVSYALLNDEAVNLGQLDNALSLKASVLDVLIKGSTNNNYSPSFDYDPATKRYADTLVADKFVGAVTAQFIAYSISDGTTPVTVTVTNGIITGVA